MRRVPRIKEGCPFPQDLKFQVISTSKIVANLKSNKYGESVAVTVPELINIYQRKIILLYQFPRP